MTGGKPHAWAAGVKNAQPVLTCTNQGCRIVWWPDRSEPKSACAGVPVGEVAR